MREFDLKDLQVKVTSSAAVDNFQCIEVEISGSDCGECCHKNEMQHSSLRNDGMVFISYMADDEIPFDELSLNEVPVDEITFDQTSLRQKIRTSLFPQQLCETTLCRGEDSTIATSDGSDESSDLSTHPRNCIEIVSRRMHQSGTLLYAETGATGKICHASTSQKYVFGQEFTSSIFDGGEASSGIAHDTEPSTEMLRKNLVVDNQKGQIHPLFNHQFEDTSILENDEASPTDFEKILGSNSDVSLTLLHSESFKDERWDIEAEDRTSKACVCEDKDDEVVDLNGSCFAMKQYTQGSYGMLPKELFEAKWSTPIMAMIENKSSDVVLVDGANLASSSFGSTEGSRLSEEKLIYEKNEDSSDSDSDSDDIELERVVWSCDLRHDTQELDEESTKSKIIGENGGFLSDCNSGKGSVAQPVKGTLEVIPRQRKSNNEVLTVDMFSYMVQLGGKDSESLVDKSVVSVGTDDAHPYDC
eukprot:scaffold1062_cov130-Cylindrotheca_fusiformis.AAC.21